MHKSSTCAVSRNSTLAELLQQATLVIWDEVPMQHKYCFEAVHRTLMDVRADDALFGGLPIVLGGDFAQILPVVQRGNRAAIVNTCLQRSFLWPSLTLLHLRQNMRVHEGPDNEQFAVWV